jgi:hypothetical protein
MKTANGVDKRPKSDDHYNHDQMSHTSLITIEDGDLGYLQTFLVLLLTTSLEARTQAHGVAYVCCLLLSMTFSRSF